MDGYKVILGAMILIWVSVLGWFGWSVAVRTGYGYYQEELACAKKGHEARYKFAIGTYCVDKEGYVSFP